MPSTLLAFTFLLLIPKTPKKLSFSACSYFFAKVTYQYLLLLVGFDTLIYRKHYNRSPTVEGHQCSGGQGERPRVGPRQEVAWTPGGPPWLPPSPIYLSRPET